MSSIFPERVGTSQALNVAQPHSDHRLAFLHEFLRSPRQIGSIVPSSRFLEQRLVEVAGVGRARMVVEFRPGTGGTTQALLRALPGGARLPAFELNPRFTAQLESFGDPRLIVHAGSALDIRTALALRGLPSPDVVLSGIPFSTMPPEMGRGILRAVQAALACGGRFVAYQFRDAVGALGGEVLGSPDVSVEWLNVPPMRVYCWRKPAVDAAGAARRRTGLPPQ